MGKTTSFVVLSSDDEDDSRLLSSKRSYTKMKSGLPPTRTAPRRPKKPRLSASQSRVSEESRNVDELKFFCEDFDKAFSAVRASSGSGKSGTKELWVEKYKPQSLEELAVHKKKVEEVVTWFKERLGTTKEASCQHALVLTGPAGVGKSATVRVISSHLGARLCEWDTPTPVIWQEHLHNSSRGVQYTSKLDEFEDFVERVRKYGVIPSSFMGESRSSVILFIDDLPLVNGRFALGRLQKCLQLLVQSVQVPTAISITDCAKADSRDLPAQCLEQLQLCLENAGACKVSFNPITNNSVKKTLSRICRLEQCDLTAEQIDGIAKASGGDIRNAITSLQFFALKPSPIGSLSLCVPPPKYLKGKADEHATSDGFSFQFGRDETLSLFHALGKFLHNKRDTKKALNPDSDDVLLQRRLLRLPLNMDAPEKVLCQAHGQARTVTDFLHENVIDFLDEEAIDDAWTVASYLNDADILLASFNGMLARYNDADNVLQSAAASVAARGVLFGNSHPLPSRWHAIRRPKLWQVEELRSGKQKEMAKQRFTAYNGLSSSDLSVIVTEYIPAFKWIGCKASGDVIPDLLVQEDPDADMPNSDGQEEISDDEIEDW